MDFSISTAPIKELIDLWKRAPDLTRAEMAAAIEESVQLVNRVVKENTPKGVTNTLVNSIFSDVEVFADNVLGVVASSVQHVVPIELGTKPHKISKAGQASIRDWVIRKLGVPAEEVDRATNAIIWKIIRKGTKGAHMFGRAFDTTEPQVRARLELGVQRLIDGLVPT